MLCEQNKEILIGAVASGEPLPLDLRTHLDSCVSCRTAFDDERRLLAAIDSGLGAAANATVPPSLLPAVHVRLAQEDASNAGRLPSAWMYLAATAALILALLPLLRPRRAIETRAQSRTEAATSAATSIPADAEIQRHEQSIERTGVANPQPHLPSALEHRANTKLHPQSRSLLARAVQPPRPEVLVPPEERIALAKYVAQASQRKLLVAIARISPAEPAMKALTIEPLKVAALKEQSLEELNR